MFARSRLRNALPVVAVLVACLAFSAAAAAAKRSRASGAEIVKVARTYTGAPYAWGASGPRRFDCSGFIAHVYGKFGYKLTHSSYGQMRIGRRVSRSELQRGDIVAWNGGGHTGLYAGNGKFISATRSRGIWTYTMRQWSRWQRFTTARRILRDQSGDPTAPDPGGQGGDASGGVVAAGG